jgi:twitching motility protein PilT
MATCLEAAQTGHLILTTLHTRGAIRTMSRILEFFPQNQSEAIMSSLSETLVFVLSQGLLPPDSGNTDQGRVLCAEFLQINTTAAKNSIRKYKAGESNLENIMNGTCNVRWNDSLTKLRADRKISEETLAEHKNDTPAADMTKSSKV